MLALLQRRRNGQAMLALLQRSEMRDDFVERADARSAVERGVPIVPVALDAYQKYGYVPIYVDLVTDEVQPPVRMPSFRVLSPS